jgi:hypothetical protein
MPDAPADYVISGWSESVGNGDPIWDRADDIDAINAAAGETVKCGRQAWNDDHTAIFDAPVRHLVTYSYANDRIQIEMERRIRLGLPLSVLQWTLIVPVNRVFDGKAWEDLVIIPDAVASATAFLTAYRGAVAGVLPVIPENCPIRNPGPARVNVECFYAGWDHSNIVGKPLVSQFIQGTQYILARRGTPPG